MTIFSCTRFVSFCLTAAISVATAAVVSAADARLETYQHEDGQTYFALTTPAIEASEATPRDVVIVLDTSASQAGVYRDTALAAVQACIANLDASDRVQVMAADLDTRSMNASLAAPNSGDIRAAIEQLDVEAPLGSTDMELAMMTASEAFDETSDRPRTVVYVGDGMSPANLLQTKSFATLVENLRQKGVAVNSYAVGPNCDNNLLAALANQTGGNLYIHEGITTANDAEGISGKRAKQENQRHGRQVGKTLANWVRAKVVYPQTTQWPDAIAKAYPQQLPPMRSDRETVVVGVLRNGASHDGVKLAANSKAGGQFTWQATNTVASTDLSFLPQLVEQADAHGGLALTTLGTKGLQETGRMLLANVDELTNLAERAVSIGDHEGASRIVQTVLRRDPGNLRAQTVQELIERGGPVDLPAGPVEAPAADQSVIVDGGFTAEGDLNMVRPDPWAGTIAGPSTGEFIGGVPARDAVVDGSFLTEIERRNRIFSEMLEKEVELAISAARDDMTSRPELASQNLKLMLENVRGAPQLIPEVRAQLVDRLQNVLQETARASAIAAEQRLEAEERQAAARELRLLNARLDRRIEKENQLVARLNALVDERRYEEAQEVADILEEVDPNGVTPVVAELWSRFDRYHYLQEITRERRHRAAWETFMQVEYSAIPFPDDPPIVYPDAEVWEDLTNRREKYKAVDLAGQDGAEQAITKALSNPLNNLGLSFQDTPLSEAVDFLRNEYNIEVQLDQPALDDLGLSADDPVNVELRNISLRSALRIMLKQLDLTYVIADEVLLITSEEEALTRLQVKVYPVADLVLPIQTPAPGGIGGGGGGQGGGQGGGLGGGGGGGGFGGGGGGFGGGGGGQFSVPETTQPAPVKASQPVQGTQEANAAPESSESLSESQSPTQKWDAYFASSARDSAVVRGEVRKLMKKGAYNEVTALIQSALRHGQPQSWMYEALGIAMQMEGRNKSEIERAVMSAADFSRSADELAYIASYLTKLDLNRRALQLYQQVVKLDPLRSEAYALGLRAAQRADDTAGVRWATVGILEQAWPADQEVVKETAWRVAKATIADLVKAGQKDEAKAFKQEIARAIQRDCVVRVSWTGDADVDVSVQEPGGSVCSAADPRAAGGGVNLGDVFTGVQGQQGGVFSETYVCPKGFAGDYRVKVTPVWGKVAAGKVTVDVYLHLNGEKVEHKREQLELGPDGLAVDFTLDQGRRVEPLEEQHIARAVERQQAVSKAVLAQQMGSLSDPRLAPLRPGARQARRRQLLQGGGEVGFQPVIVTLPEGTNFFATGVVSADRRYVRITSVPFFSIIGDVSTFTFAGAGAEVEGDDEEDGGDAGAVGAAF